MKSLCLILLLAISVPGCSRFTKTGRMDRAYYKQLNQAKVQREKRQKQLIAQQQAEMKKATSDNAPPPTMPTVQTTTQSQ